MVLMKGTKRVLEKSITETSSSSTARTISLYGVTSYNELNNVIISIVSNASTSSGGAVTLNINNLGNKNIKSLNSGVKSNPVSGWIGVGQIYQVFYDGTDFVLLNNLSSNTPSSNAYYLTSAILSLTNSSTAAQIKAAFVDADQHTSQEFISTALEGLMEVIINDGTNIYVNYKCIYTNNTLTSVILDFINNGVYTKQTYTISSGDFASVVVETSDLLLRNGNTIQF